MKIYSTNEVRNVAVLGHSGCGKTTITEAALLLSGVIKRMGKVEEGNTVSDYDQEETKRKVSINTSIIPIEWLNNKINFLDTPGYFDFVGEVKEALSAADIALIVVSAKSGVEVGTEKAWEFADELNIPKFIFVNGMDDEHADINKVLDDLRGHFGNQIAPLQVPFVENGKFAGFINVIKKEAKKIVGNKTEKCNIPAGLDDSIESISNMITEAVAETSEELMEKFFNEEPFTIEEIYKGLRTGILEGTVAPVVFGAASLNVGIDSLLNSLIKFVPPSSELKTKYLGIDPRTDDSIERLNNEKGDLSAFVFKTIADPYVGRLNIFKVLSGTLKKDTHVYNSRKDNMEKIGHLYVLRGKEQIEVDEVRAGDIGAISKLSNTSTQDTLCQKDKAILFPEIKFPESLMSMAIVPKGKGDEDKISSALNKLLEEDPTLKMEVNAETKQSLVFGIGEQHLDILISKLRSKYKIEAELIKPIIPYREMIKGKAQIRGKYKKQSGGHGQYGDVLIEFEPSSDLTTQYIFEEKIFGGSVPKQYFPAVEKGLIDSINHGVLADYPVVGLKATLIDGSYHPVDSSEMAFKMATTLAFKEGLPKAKPTLLEPIARVTVTVPDDYTGDIMGDLNKRRGRILGMNPLNGKQQIEAEVPISEMFKYSTDLRSMTQSRGGYTMAFERYDEAPIEMQQKIIEARKKEKSE